MTDSDPEPSESGIRKFFRGILPQWPRPSPLGTATPTAIQDTIDNGTNVDQLSISCLKRKSSYIKSYDESDDSDCEESLPSSKRQRITVSAMRRLFAKFSLSEKDLQTSPTNINHIPAQHQEPHNPFSLKPANTQQLRPNNYQTTSRQASNNNQSNIPDMNNPKAGGKRETTQEEGIEGEAGEKRRKKSVEGSKFVPSAPEQEDSKEGHNNKRQVDASDSGDEDNMEHSNKIKRTRRLRRGLRLCTNITCYIEQVLYN